MTRTDTPSKQKRLEKIIQSFEKRRAKNDLAIPIVDGDVRNLNLVIMAKNLFNFYHFTLETLPSLALYREYNLTGLIIIHTATKRQGDFVKDQVLSLFPELAPRVALQYADIRLSKALVVLDSKFLYFQTHDDQMPSIGDLCRKSWLWRDRDLDRQSHKTLTMNSYAQPLRMLRDRVVARVQETADDQAALAKPRRLYVRRKQAGRLRGIVNEDLLIEMLHGLGFETVYFEDHNVLEQARLMSQAEIVVSVHGAGMTNMLYVPEGCLIVELSSLQIIMLRFGDFNPLALASKAKYLHFVVDHDWPDQETIPDFKTNSIVGLKVDELAVQQLRARLLEHVEEVEFETLMEEGRSLNDASDFDALGELLDDYAGRLLHKADMHVWAANCAASGGDFHGALDHLLRAVRLAPMRQLLLERELLLAQRLGQQITFDAIASDYFCHSESAARFLFAENGLGLPDGIEPDVPSVAEK
ncbi:glycosyltransferase family 61 protein [Rhodobacteraceae bacterium S2214]|nr:glycosyltransferase family 61 protein [Rhodobacteraceae bacterium S2214]